MRYTTNCCYSRKDKKMALIQMNSVEEAVLALMVSTLDFVVSFSEIAILAKGPNSKLTRKPLPYREFNHFSSCC